MSLKRELAQEGVRAQRADFLPQVAAIGGGSFYNYQVAGLVPRWAVGVGVNIKIFDGLNREYKYSAAKQTVRRVGELQNKAGKDIAVLVEKLYNQMMNYRNQMTSIDASLKFAEEYLRMKNAAFLEGMSSSSDLIDAELNLAGVRTERLQAAYNYDLFAGPAARGRGHQRRISVLRAPQRRAGGSLRRLKKRKLDRERAGFTLRPVAGPPQTIRNR